MFKKLLAMLLVLLLVGSPLTALAGESFAGNENLYPENLYEGEFSVSQELADDIVGQLFGETPNATLSGDGYEYRLSDSTYESIINSLDESIESIGGITEVDQTEEPEDASVNILPEGYVDNSNEGLDSIQPKLLSSRTRAASTSTKVEVVFIIDSTGSMSSAISGVKNNVAQFAAKLYEKGLTLRLGLIDFKDITYDGLGTTVVHKQSYSPWFTSYAEFLDALKTVSATGGGDEPETPIDALGFLVDDTTMLWSSDAYKFAILVTDASYKVNNRQGISSMNDLISRLDSRGIYTSVITGTSLYRLYADLATQTAGILANIYGDFASILNDYAESVYTTAAVAPVNYSVKITDASTGLPVPDARIEFTGGSATSQTNGVAILTSRVNPITNVEISKTGYQTYYASSLSLANNMTIPLQLSSTGGGSSGGGSGGGGGAIFTADMLTNPTSSSQEISGPAVSIFGKSFNLLKLPSSLQLKLFDAASIKINHDETKKTFTAIIGSIENIESTDHYWSDYDAYKNIVQTFTSKSANQIKTDFTRLKGQFKNPAKLLFPVEINEAGYLEASYASGELQLVEGGVIIATKVGTPFGVSYPLPPAPYVFVKVEVSVDASLKIALVRVVSSGKVSFQTSVEAKVTPGVTGTLNLGVDKLAYVGGGVKGSLESKFKIPSKLSETLTVTLKGSWVWKIKLGFLEFKGENAWGDGIQLFPQGRSRTLAYVTEDNFSLIPRPAPTFRSARLARSLPLPEFIRFDENVYESGNPQLVQLDNGNLLLAWLGDDTNRSLAANASALYYSIYDGSSWSSAALVDDDGTADFNPALFKAADGSVHLVWQDCKAAFTSDEVGLEDFAEAVDISYISFSADGSIGTKINITGTADNSVYETGAVLSASEDSVSVVWLENSENDLLLASGTNSIRRVKIIENIPEGAETLTQGLPFLTHLASGYIDSERNVIAYTTGAFDGEDGTLSEDPTIRLAGDIADTVIANTVLSEDDDVFATVSGLQFVDGALFWSDNDGIKAVANVTAPSIELVNALSAHNFTILKNGDNVAIVMLTSGITNEIYVSYKDADGWSAPTSLTAYGKSIGAISGLLDNEGKIYLTFNQTTLNGESFDGAATDLVVAGYERSMADLAVDEEAYIPYTEIIPGAETYISVYAQNNGATSTSAIKALVTLDGGAPQEITTLYRIPEDGNGIEGIVPVAKVNAGETVELLIPYTLPAVLSANHKLTVELVSANGIPGALGNSNKIAAFEFGAQPDLEVSDVSANRIEGGALISAVVKNIGFASADHVVVKLFDEIGYAAESEPLQEQSFATLPAGSQEAVSFTVSDDLLVAGSEYDFKRFIVSAETDSFESVLYNNSGDALVAPLNVESVALAEHEIDINVGDEIEIAYSFLPENVPNKEVTWHSSNVNIASVSSDGKITGLREGEAVVTVISVADGSISDSATVHVVGLTKAVSGVSISPKDVTLAIGERQSLSATVTPSDATNQDVTWYSENPSIVSVDESGNITGVAEGATTIYAVTNDGGYNDSAVVTVTTAPPANDATLSALTLSAGTLTPAFNPDIENYSASVANSVSSVTITATANDPDASITGDGIKALNVGVNTFTLTVEGGTTTQTYTVAITRAQSTGSNNSGDGNDYTSSSSSGGTSTPATTPTVPVVPLTPETEATDDEDALTTIDTAPNGVPLSQAPVQREITKSDLTYIYGQNRVLTSVAISKLGWTNADTIVLAPGAEANLIDALAVAPLAYQENAPILLSVDNTIDPAVLAEIQRLGATKIIAVGALSDSLIEQLQTIFPNIEIEVLRGADRFATASLISAKINNPQGTVVVGYDAIADAVSIASWAAANAYAIHIANPDGSANPPSYGSGNASGTNYILGGSTLVQDIPGYIRIYGLDRYATNLALRQALSFNNETIYTADGNTLVDALTGSVLAAKTRSAIVLTPNNDPTGVDFGDITAETKVYGFGGAK
jgi:hypothetical protein